MSWLPELQEAYANDAALGMPIDCTKQGDIAESNSPAGNSKQMHTKQGSWTVSCRNGLWHTTDGLLVIPDCPSIRRQILIEMHDSQ